MARSGNATEMFLDMYGDVRASGFSRQVTDPSSPTKDAVLEAKPGRAYELFTPTLNVVGCKSIDLKWAIANVLHFFSASTDGRTLPKYNKHAERFLVDGQWEGAYGAIAMPQIAKCIAKLREHPSTRRAIVTMGGLEHDDINRPTCWTALHFLLHRGTLDLIVYQRSLHLFRVMPYDLIVLTNVLNYVVEMTRLPMGSLHWLMGSLHTGVDDANHRSGERNRRIILPSELLNNPSECLLMLEDPGSFHGSDHARILATEGEVRT